MYDLLTNTSFWGIVSLLIAVELLFNLIGHIKFYYKIWKDKELDEQTKTHSLKLMLIVFAVFGAVSSVCLYGINWVAYGGGDAMRTFLKIVQIFSLIGLRVSFGGLRSYYISLGDKRD